MTTASESGGRRHNSTLMWLGHHSIKIMVPAMLIVVAYYLTGLYNAPDPVGWTIAGVWLFWYFTMTLDERYHEARLCERCVAATPLDPQAAVSRWKPALRATHARNARTAVLILILAWAFGGAYVVSSHSWPYRAGGVLVALILAGIAVADWVHRKLYPWCPWCNWGGGGEHEEVPDPDPADSKPLPV
jgi:hypothetical protein